MRGDIADLNAHRAALHEGPPKTAEEWERAAESLIVAAGLSGREFQINQVLKPLGPHPLPSKRQYVNGTITKRVKDRGLIRLVTVEHSTKDGTNSSFVARWVGVTDQAVAA